jgi:phosphoglycolate phosphatase
MVATQPTIRECLHRALGELGRTIPADEALSAVLASGLTLPDTFLALSPGLTPGQVETCVRTYRHHYPSLDAERSVLFDSVPPSLARLRQLGIALIVLTNKGYEAAFSTLDRLGLADSIDHILAAKQDEPTKPHPDVFHRRVVPLLGRHAPADYLMIGDTEIDLRFARNVGLRSCWASYGYGDRARCRALAPDYEIVSFAGLVDIATGAPAVLGASPPMPA